VENYEKLGAFYLGRPYDLVEKKGEGLLLYDSNLGKCPTQETREKIILAVGNVQGVAQVDDRIDVVKEEPAGLYHTVISGDTLSKLAKTHYGDPMKYPIIFAANQPMLKHPDKIYVGQVLRIPPVDEHLQ
jgi:hypothetical protein